MSITTAVGSSSQLHVFIQYGKYACDRLRACCGAISFIFFRCISFLSPKWAIRLEIFWLRCTGVVDAWRIEHLQEQHRFLQEEIEERRAELHAQGVHLDELRRENGLLRDSQQRLRAQLTDWEEKGRQSDRMIESLRDQVLALQRQRDAFVNQLPPASTGHPLPYLHAILSNPQKQQLDKWLAGQRICRG
jgi:septal ring factor EnvC (AmiA/AmiB activator)